MPAGRDKDEANGRVVNSTACSLELEAANVPFPPHLLNRICKFAFIS